MKSNTEKLQEVENRLKHEENRRMYEHYLTIRLFLMGHDRKQIATILGRTERTIWTYIHCY